jgi:hypothetical protein
MLSINYDMLAPSIWLEFKQERAAESVHFKQTSTVHLARRAVYAPRVVVGVIAPRFATHMVHRCDEGYLVIGSHDVVRVD